MGLNAVEESLVFASTGGAGVGGHGGVWGAGRTLFHGVLRCSGRWKKNMAGSYD